MGAIGYGVSTEVDNSVPVIAYKNLPNGERELIGEYVSGAQAEKKLFLSKGSVHTYLNYKSVPKRKRIGVASYKVKGIRYHIEKKNTNVKPQ